MVLFASYKMFEFYRTPATPLNENAETITSVIPSRSLIYVNMSILEYLPHKPELYY